MNTQEIFDTVARFLIRQGKRSLGYSCCLYRGPEGTKCAVGCLIPDEFYNSWMENKTISQLTHTHNTPLPDYIINNVRLLSKLQIIHDKADGDFIPTIKSKMREIASEYLLNDAVLDEQEVVVDNRFDPNTWGL